MEVEEEEAQSAKKEERKRGRGFLLGRSEKEESFLTEE